MAARQVRQQKALTTMAAMKRKSRECPSDKNCNCQTGQMPKRATQPLLHMDECDDPECIDFEQLQELQKSIDRFTDYDHYERCCDGNHAEGEECNGHANSCCPDSSVPSEECDECFDDCEECVEEHEFGHLDDSDSMIDAGTPIKCDDSCLQCEEDCEENGHERKDCPQNHHTSWDSCISTCGVCVDPTPLPLLGPEAEMQIYGLNTYMPHITPCDERCTPPPDIGDPIQYGMPNTQQSAFDVNLDHWQTFQQAHHCAPDPCLVNQTVPQFQPPQHVDPGFGFTFGCDPTIPGNQYPWQQHEIMRPTCAVQAFESLDLTGLAHNMNDFTPVNFSVPEQSTNPGKVLRDINTLNTPKSPPTKISPSLPKTGKSCQWLMPCGSICGQAFARTDDLKKHVKNSHLSLKGTVTCRWGSACSATFATEAALTGHISKKHLAPLYAAGSTTTSNVDKRSPVAESSSSQAEELPWKCTFPGCNKSFMYKQVRDDHSASHTGSNRAHCPICHQWLNAEGSNFRRHLLSHRPEKEHMRCKHSHLGCKRTFPRLDNLRRHHTTCKYGKRAAAAEASSAHEHAHVHHRHHHVHHHMEY